MATLKLTSLHCDRRQDLFGQDEIVIVVNKQTAWFDSMRKGETKSLLPTAVDFDDVATVTVSERDGDKDKPIGGSLNVNAEGHNQSPLVFKTSGAHYELYYEVIHPTKGGTAGKATTPTTAAKS